jgi:hypothetical protein
MFQYPRRLRAGKVPPQRVLWLDMVVVGSLVNMATTMLSFVLFAASAPTAVGSGHNSESVRYRGRSSPESSPESSVAAGSG